MAIHLNYGVNWVETRGSMKHNSDLLLFISYRTYRYTSNTINIFPYRELVHLVTHLCETLKAKKLDCVLVIPPGVTRYTPIRY